MAFWGDYHTHTTYSRRGKKLHAKGTVMENAVAAQKAGLKELAITDHGFKHYYGVADEQAYLLLKEECRKAEKATGVKIYAGLENNLDWRSGKKRKKKSFSPFIKLTPQVIAELEIIQGGYHAMIGTPDILRNMLFWARNVIFKFLPGRKRLIKRNTEAYKRAIDEYDMDFIGHLNRGILADAVEVAKYAHERGVYIELNGRHKSLTEKEIKQMVDAGVEFICNSDAHTPSAVGTMPVAQKMIEEYGIPLELIANWERLPDFRSQNFRAKREQNGQGERDVR